MVLYRHRKAANGITKKGIMKIDCNFIEILPIPNPRQRVIIFNKVNKLLTIIMGYDIIITIIDENLNK
jgi:hypothetical protein